MKAQSYCGLPPSKRLLFNHKAALFILAMSVQNFSAASFVAERRLIGLTQESSSQSRSAAVEKKGASRPVSGRVPGSQGKNKPHKTGLIEAQFSHNIQFMGADGFVTSPGQVGNASWRCAGSHHGQNSPFTVR